jgi:hypothetical protein
MINEERKYCYRITHIENLPLILQRGIVCKRHPMASTEYINIGNRDVIQVRDNEPVRLNGYGNIGDYVPFYFTPRSLMLFNIITGYWAPLVPKRNKSDILVIRCVITELAKLEKWFFTNGQGNDMVSSHFNDLKQLEEIDWDIIQKSEFSKSDGDYDRPRRYQAEFLVKDSVPVDSIESLVVFNQAAADKVAQTLRENNTNLAVHIHPSYFFG